VIGGRYYLRLHREPHAWLITERRLDVRYTTGDRSILKLLTS
jgi:hypothetical protein